MSTSGHTSCAFTDTQEAGKLKSHSLDPVQGWMECQLGGHPHGLKSIFTFFRYFSSSFFSASVFVLLWAARGFLDLLLFSQINCEMLSAARRMATAAVLCMLVEPLGMALRDIF